MQFQNESVSYVVAKRLKEISGEDKEKRIRRKRDGEKPRTANRKRGKK